VLIGLSITPVINENCLASYYTNQKSDNYDSIQFSDCKLDMDYIFSITENLSRIIFTEYNESAGEIAKGRAFGTKGEHKAAEILLENMSKLGLWAYKEKIGNAKPSFRPINLISSKIEVLDYELRIKNETINKTLVCAPIISTFGPHWNILKIDHNFSYSDLKVKLDHPDPCNDTEEYVILAGPGSERGENPPPENKQDRGYLLDVIIDYIKGRIEKIKNFYQHPNCKAIVGYTRFDNEHNQWNSYSSIPKFSINGTNGKMIEEDYENFTVDFYLNQRKNNSVESYNVIGQLNGTNPRKTVIVCCLYDSWWCQGTGDSAIGMGIVMGIAKWFAEHYAQQKPNYTMKFIGFGGEEYGMHGSIYYEWIHKLENIIYVVDLNQVGFTQEYPRLTLNVTSNNQEFLDEIWKIVQRTDYINRTGNVTDIDPDYYSAGHNSDDRSFASMRSPDKCKTLCFLKNGDWYMHHKDGLNHTVGDVIDYFNWTDSKATGEIILNVTKYLVLEKEDISINQEKSNLSYFIRNIFKRLLSTKD